MKGMIFKDLINLKKAWAPYLLLVLILSAICIIFPPMAAVLPFSTSVLIMGTTSNDEASGWLRLSSAMPVSRREYVKAKFIVHLGIVGASIVLSMIIMTFSICLFYQLDTADVTAIILSCLITGIIPVSVFLPVNLGLTPEKSKLLNVMLIFIPEGILIAASSLLKIRFAVIFSGAYDILHNNIVLITAITIPIIIITPFISYALTCKLFGTREL